MGKQKPKNKVNTYAYTGNLDPFGLTSVKKDATVVKPGANGFTPQDIARIELEKEVARRKTYLNPQGKSITPAMRQAIEDRLAQEKTTALTKKIAEGAQTIGGALELAAPFTGPFMPIVGGVGAGLGIGSSAYLAGKDAIAGDYGSAALNAGFGALDLAGFAALKNPAVKDFVQGADHVSDYSQVVDLTDVPDAYKFSPFSIVGKESKVNRSDIFNDFMHEALGRIPSVKKRVARDVKEGNDWLKDWIDHPFTQKKIIKEFEEYRVNNGNFIDQGLLRDRGQVMNYQPNVGVYPLSKQFSEAIDLMTGNKAGGFYDDMIHEGNRGVSYIHSSPYGTTPWHDRFGSWVSASPHLTSAERASTVTHEGTHDWLRSHLIEDLGINDKVLSQLKDEYRDAFLKRRSLEAQGLGDDEVEKIMGKQLYHYGYLADPTEVHARTMQIRKAFDLTPDYKVTPKDWINIEKEGPSAPGRINPGHFKLFKSPEAGAKIMNDLLAVPAVIGAGAVAAEQLQTEPEQQKNGGWLDKYEDGGELNYNDYSVSAPEGFQGEGYSNVGRNYSPAWGGQFAMGGSMPGSVGFMYARTNDPAPSNGPYAKKTKASAKDGIELKEGEEKESAKQPAKQPATKSEDRIKKEEKYVNRAPLDIIEEGRSRFRYNMLEDAVRHDLANELLIPLEDVDKKELKKRTKDLLLARERKLSNPTVEYVKGNGASKTEGVLGYYDPRNKETVVSLSDNLDNYDVDEFGNTVRHEFRHAYDDAGALLTNYEKELIKNKTALGDVDKIKAIGKERYDYLTTPTEVTARLQEIRGALKDAKIPAGYKRVIGSSDYERDAHGNLIPEYYRYDPKSDKVKSYWLQNIKNNTGLQDLLDVMKPEDVVELLNKIAANNPQQGMPMAKNGKKIIPVDKDSTKIKEDNDWLTNWYTNRKIPNQQLQALYEEDKPYYLERLKNIPEVTNVDLIGDDPRITGRYKTDTNQILMTPEAKDNVYLHEADHYVNNFPSAMREVHGNIADANIVPKENLTGVYKDKYDYFSDPEEVHSRIQVLRKKAKLKPDEEVTPERLNKFLKTYKGDDENINNLLDLSDTDHLLEMLNYMAYNQPSSKSNVAKNGSNMSYYQNGLDFKPKTISRDGSQLVKLDQLTNFTNYNTKQPGGWLDKYEG